MIPTEQKRFDALYEQHLRGLKLHGYSTIDVYSRAVRRLATYYDCVPDQLSVEQLEVYFAALVDSHSWATVRVDRNGLQFFWKYVLKQDWQWLEIIKAPKIQSLPDILTPRQGAPGAAPRCRSWVLSGLPGHPGRTDKTVNPPLTQHRRSASLYDQNQHVLSALQRARGVLACKKVPHQTPALAT